MEIELIQCFVKVVQNGSITKAALALGLPKSTVSKSLSRLESQLGTKLIQRTTRSLSVTAAGGLFFEKCQAPISQLEEATQSLRSVDQIISGRVRITLPEDIGIESIAKELSQLTVSYPKLSFELAYTDQVVDLVRQGFDFAIRIGKLPSSGLRAKKIGEMTLVLVAAPEYLKRHPQRLEKPQDLSQHVCVSMSVGSNKSIWALRARHQVVKVRIRTSVSANQMTNVLQFVLAGAGIGLIPQYLVGPHIQHNRLIRVLPEWKMEGLPVSLVSPTPFSESARLKLVTDRLSDSIKKELVSI